MRKKRAERVFPVLPFLTYMNNVYFRMIHPKFLQEVA